MKDPKVQVWLWLVISFALIALALFLSAGTLGYWQAWAYLGVGAASSVPLTLHILDDPILLANRTRAGPAAEERPIQKIIVLCAGLPAIATFIVPGLDHRFGWSEMPSVLALAGDLLVGVAMWMVYRVFAENPFGSATVEIGRDQTVTSTGPYALVRHPMYASAAVYFVGVALALGSSWALIPAVLTILGLVWRLLDEEQFLARNLPGYAAYCARVRWHLIPGLF